MNQFENEGPRTNNHVEGHNAALNRHIKHKTSDSKPRFEIVLDCVRTMETVTRYAHAKNMLGKSGKQVRRRVDIQRDAIFFKLKNDYLAQKISLIEYLKRLSLLFDLQEEVSFKF